MPRMILWVIDGAEADIRAVSNYVYFGLQAELGDVGKPHGFETEMLESF